MKTYAKIMIAGATLFFIGLIIFIVFLGLNDWNLNGDYEMQTYTCEENVKTLKIDFSAGVLVTEYVDSETITVEYPENSKLTTKFVVNNNGTLSMTTHRTGWFNFGFLGFNKIPTTIVKIPKGTVLDLNLNMNAGTVTLAEAEYGKVSINLSAGTLDMKSSVCSELSCDLSAGTAYLRNVECGKLEAELSAGMIDVTTLTCPDISVDISAGSASFKINGAKSDYTIKIDKSAGSCNVSNQTGGSKRIDAEISAGSLNFTFTN